VLKTSSGATGARGTISRGAVVIGHAHSFAESESSWIKELTGELIPTLSER